MPFFIRGRGRASTNKKKLVRGPSYLNERNSLPPSKKQRKRLAQRDEEITSDEDEAPKTDFQSKEDDSAYNEIEETPQEKKFRLAKQYIEEIRKQKEDEVEDEEELQKAVGLKLKEDILEAAGKLQQSVASYIDSPDLDSIKALRCRHHKLSLTCLVASYDEKYIFTASKDCSIVKWTLQGEKLGVIHGAYKSKEVVDEDNLKVHESHVLSLALSMDGKYLASGDRDGQLHIWDGETLKFLHSFSGHRGAISGLVFRRGTNTLYSASHDRLVMTWNLDVMAFAESLGGHQDCITGIDSLYRECCITSGGRDEMVIVYVIPDEKQLRFSASQQSIDGIKLINEKSFITYGQNGSLALWTTLKKKPHFTVQAAHGTNPENGEPYWLTSVAAFVNADVVASGSSDGFVRLWKVEKNHRKLEKLFDIPVPGVVNGLEFTSSGSHLIAAVGQEHKLGRWFNVKNSKNALYIIPLTIKKP